MRRYSMELKESITKRLRPPFNENVIALSKKEGIPVATLYTWLNREPGFKIMVSKKVSEKGLSAELRFTILVESALMSELELSEYCRGKGLYPEQIKQWKQECLIGMGEKAQPSLQDKTQARKDKKTIQQLEKELNRKEKALAEAAALLILRKKLQAFYEEGNEDD